MSAKIVVLIESEQREGNGSVDDVHRIVKTWFTPDGELVVHKDEWYERRMLERMHEARTEAAKIHLEKSKEFDEHERVVQSLQNHVIELQRVERDLRTRMETQLEMLAERDQTIAMWRSHDRAAGRKRRRK